MTRTRILPAAVVAALLALNWYAAVRTIDVAPITPAATSTDAPSGGDALEPSISGAADAGTLNDGTENAFLARPLFSPTRRPSNDRQAARQTETAEDTQIVDGTPSAEPSGLRLIGVMQIGRDERRALIRAANAPNGLWLALGGEVDGWRVSTIEPETVVVAKSGGTEQLVLRRSAADDAR